MSDKKLYRVDFTYEEAEDDGQMAFRSDVVFIGATSELEATDGITGVEFMIREATYEEVEAYVRGYGDGRDNAIVKERLKDYPAKGSR
jgi:hypothetical protein